MKKDLVALIIFLGLSLVNAGVLDFDQPSKESTFIDRATEALQKRVKNYPGADKLYHELFYTPVWVGSKAPTAFAKTLLDHIEGDSSIPPSLGLSEDVKKLRQELDDLYKGSSTLGAKIEMELKLSRLYLNYMHYLLYGGIDWKAFDDKLEELTKQFKIKVGWEHYRPDMTPASLLVEATMSGDLNSAFAKAEPKRFKYAKLKKELERYLKIAKEGGWEALPSFKAIKPAQSHPAIPLIRRHLRMEGDLPASASLDSEEYDETLQKAIRRFKLRHGLSGTPVIDQETRRWLNMSVEQKIALLRLNLDRIKWIWRQEAPVRIELNIPAFRLYFYEGEHLVDTMRVITGKPDHPTPVFHNTMKMIVVNPYWKIPESIVRSEMLKHLVKDPYYYERRGKVLRAGWDENSPRVDPGTVNWSQYVGNHKTIPYRFMQVPGTKNALGKIKFLFPNKYSVYIHDTPTKKLFFESTRAFSHGCMRIQKPRELLKVLALYNSNIDVEEIMKQLGTRNKKTINLTHEIPVDIVYLTAFVDDYGNLNFRNDIYRYDEYQMQNYAYIDKDNQKPKQKSKKDKISSNSKSKKNSSSDARVHKG